MSEFQNPALLAGVVTWGATRYLPDMNRNEIFFAVMLVATGIALVVVGLFVLADRAALVRGVLVVSGALSLVRAAFLFLKRRNAERP